MENEYSRTIMITRTMYRLAFRHILLTNFIYMYERRKQYHVFRNSPSVECEINESLSIKFTNSNAIVDIQLFDCEYFSGELWKLVEIAEAADVIESIYSWRVSWLVWLRKFNEHRTNALNLLHIKLYSRIRVDDNCIKIETTFVQKAWN